MADYHGYAYVTNRWGCELKSIFLRHCRGNDESREESITLENVNDIEERKGPLCFTYTTSMGSPFDYWYIRIVEVSGNVYECKDDFYCSVSSDDGGEVEISLQGNLRDFRINFNSSSGCKCRLSKSI